MGKYSLINKQALFHSILQLATFWIQHTWPITQPAPIRRWIMLRTLLTNKCTSFGYRAGLQPDTERGWPFRFSLTVTVKVMLVLRKWDCVWGSSRYFERLVKLWSNNIFFIFLVYIVKVPGDFLKRLYIFSLMESKTVSKTAVALFFCCRPVFSVTFYI